MEVQPRKKLISDGCLGVAMAPAPPFVCMPLNPKAEVQPFFLMGSIASSPWSLCRGSMEASLFSSGSVPTTTRLCV